MQAAQDTCYQMNAMDVSQTMRGLANLRLESRLLVQSLVSRATTILDTFNAQVDSFLIAVAWPMGLDQEMQSILAGTCLHRHGHT